MTQLPEPDDTTHDFAGDNGLPAASSAVIVSALGAPPVPIAYRITTIPEPPAPELLLAIVPAFAIPAPPPPPVFASAFPPAYSTPASLYPARPPPVKPPARIAKAVSPEMFPPPAPDAP